MEPYGSPPPPPSTSSTPARRWRIGPNGGRLLTGNPGNRGGAGRKPARGHGPYVPTLQTSGKLEDDLYSLQGEIRVAELLLEQLTSATRVDAAAVTSLLTTIGSLKERHARIQHLGHLAVPFSELQRMIQEFWGAVEANVSDLDVRERIREAWRSREVEPITP